MLTSEFDYQLPEERIAQYPAPRGESRLLVLDAGPPGHRTVGDLPELLRPGDLLVVNNTRVMPARLLGRRQPTGGAVEIFLAERLDELHWQCLARPGRRARPQVRVRFEGGLEAEFVERLSAGRYRVRFSEPVEPHLERIGHMPLPPYIKRPDEALDRSRYQTVYAKVPGAVAAPTAGLHLSHDLLQRLAAAGVERTEITLHVGTGTFKPVRSELVHEHRMEAEEIEIPAAAAAAIRRCRERGGRVVAVGTTVVRALESSARRHAGGPRAGRLSSDLFIYPGFEFRVIDRLLTNFHLPRSTLLMLVCAFGGRRRVLAAYAEAVAAGYRFYSYGDAMLLERS